MGRSGYQSGDALKRATSHYNAPKWHIGLSHARAHAPARYRLIAYTRPRTRAHTHRHTLRALLPAPCALRQNAPRTLPHAPPERRHGTHAPTPTAPGGYRRLSIYSGGGGIGTGRGGEGVKPSSNYIIYKAYSVNILA